MFVGPSAVNIFRMEMILRGLKFEHEFPGARMTAKAPKCSTIVRRDYGLMGKHAALIEQFEPLVVARKPFRGTVAANVLEHGTGALNIDAKCPDGILGSCSSSAVGCRFSRLFFVNSAMLKSPSIMAAVIIRVKVSKSCCPSPLPR